MSRVTLGGEGGKLIDRLAQAQSLRKELFDFVEQIFFKWQSRAAGFVVRSWNKKGQTRTGGLVRGIDAGVFREDGLPVMEVGVLRGPSVPYAGVQEHGTKSENPESPFPQFITPRKGKALAMPVGEALTPAGVARYEGPRSYPEELVFIPINRGDVAGRLVLKSELDLERELHGEVDYSRLESLYILLYRARITPKFYIRDGVRQFMPILSEELAKALVTDFI